MGVRPIENAAMLLLGLIWGSAFLFNHVVVREVPPFTIVAGRLVLSAAVLVALVFAAGQKLPPRAMWPVIALIAAVNNVAPFTLITWAQEHITSSLAATLNSTMPLFTLLIAHFTWSERANAEKAAGLAVGFVGALILIGPDITDITSSSTLGEFAVIGGSVCYAAGTVLSREKMHGAPVSLAAGQMIFGALLAIPLALAFDGVPDYTISMKAALSWVAVGVLSSGIAYIIFFTLVQRITATQISVVSYLIPIVATVLGWLVLDESIGVNLFAGLALILIGMTLVNGNLRMIMDWVRGRGGGVRVAKV